MDQIKGEPQGRFWRKLASKGRATSILTRIHIKPTVEKMPNDFLSTSTTLPSLVVIFLAFSSEISSLGRPSILKYSDPKCGSGEINFMK
ncbi:hypothetical protein PanWU01x14_328530 [Parasponia andersonii]|uniref:Uncharacterized protein n=1 Tax=Parasponia andersonii TaxID=3476 RepID=A0A2P5AIS1_PARAD|nr:hypothetical protein PanWU01x14_328530 [Parasponia andersonii]